MTAHLKACPFCGGRAEFNEHDDECYFTKLKATEQANGTADMTPFMALIPAWNRRASASASSEPVAVPAGMAPAAKVLFSTSGWRALVDALASLEDGADIYTAAQVQAMLAQADGAARAPLTGDMLARCSREAHTVCDRNPSARWATEFAHAIEAAHGITAAQKGGQHGTE